MMTGSSIEVFEWSGATVSPAVDSAGVFVIEAFSNALRRLEAEGVRVERHDVRKDKSALDANPTVKNAFERFQQHYERLRLLGLCDEDLTKVVETGATAAAGLVRDDMLTRLDQFLSFGPQGKLPKPRCTCADKV